MTESLPSGEARIEEPGFPGPSQGETRALTARCVGGRMGRGGQEQPGTDGGEEKAG